MALNQPINAETSGYSRAHRRRVARSGTLRPVVLLDFLAGALPGGLQFSRASNATVTGPDGVLRWAPANYLRWSEDLANALWVKPTPDVATVTPGQPDPEGGATAWLVDLSAGADARIAQDLGTHAPSAGSLTFSCWMRTVPGDADGLWGLMLRRRDDAAVSELVPLTSEWRRVVFTYDAIKGPQVPLVWIGSRRVVGHTLTRALVWRPQIEAGTEARPYNRTEATPWYGSRFDHDGATGAPLGLLMEVQRTNLNPFSEQATVGFVANSAATQSLHGWTIRAITGDGTLNTHGGIASSAAVPAASTLHTVSAVVRYVSGSPFVQLTGGAAWVSDAAEGYANFNLSTGVVQQVGTAASNANIQSLGAGFYRISCAVTSSAAPNSATAVAVFFLSTGNEKRAPANTSTSRIDMGLMQLEVGPTATSYIPTFGVAATRAADICSMAVDSLHRPDTGTLFAEWVRNTIPQTGLSYNPIVATLHSGAANRMAILCGSASPAQQRWDTVEGGAQQASVGMPLGMPGAVMRLAANYAAGSFRSSQNGTLGGVAGGLVPQGITTMDIGCFGSSGQLGGHIRRIAYYRDFLSDDQLQELTAT